MVANRRLNTCNSELQPLCALILFTLTSLEIPLCQCVTAHSENMQQLFFARAKAVDWDTALNYFSNTADLPRRFHTDPSSSSAHEVTVGLGPECEA